MFRIFKGSSALVNTGDGNASELNAPVILPVNFPEAPAVETPEDAFSAGYKELRHWDFASENPSRLKKRESL